MCFKNSQIRNDGRRPFASSSRQEVELAHEGPRRLAQHDDDFAGARADLRRAAGAGHSDLRRIISADDGRIQIGKAIDLSGAEETHIDASALEPVAEYFGHAHDEIS